MKCKVCENIIESTFNGRLFDCEKCLSYFSIDEKFIGLNLTNNFSNDNFISFDQKDYLYYTKNGQHKIFKLEIPLNDNATAKEKYEFLKSFLDNMIFL